MVDCYNSLGLFVWGFIGPIGLQTLCGAHVGGVFYSLWVVAAIVKWHKPFKTVLVWQPSGLAMVRWPPRQSACRGLSRLIRLYFIRLSAIVVYGW